MTAGPFHSPEALFKRITADGTELFLQHLVLQVNTQNYDGRSSGLTERQSYSSRCQWLHTAPGSVQGRKTQRRGTYEPLGNLISINNNYNFVLVFQ